MLEPSRFIDALRFRTNIFGTKTTLARTKKDIDVTCRRCRAQPETLGYVLGLCQFTKGLRIKRHDEVKMFVANELRELNEVFVEPTIKVGGKQYKPDLVVKNEERILIVDVTVAMRTGITSKELIKKSRQIPAILEFFEIYI